MIVYVSIGNSDDRLTQAEWSRFVADARKQIDNTVCGTAPDKPWGKVHGAWFSAPADPWQNACWCAELIDDERGSGLTPAQILKDRLAPLAREYRQDSIAWAEVKTTEFLGAPS